MRIIDFLNEAASVASDSPDDNAQGLVEIHLTTGQRHFGWVGVADEDVTSFSRATFVSSRRVGGTFEEYTIEEGDFLLHIATAHIIAAAYASKDQVKP